MSTDPQDVANQRHGIFEYANEKGLTGLKFFEDSASGMIKWQDRKLGDLLINKAQSGDTILFSEVSRMGRSLLQILEVLQLSLSKELNVYVVKQGFAFDDSLNAKITATVFGLAAEIDRELNSQRTKEALAKRKAAGMVLGRPKGKSKKLLLDKKSAEIIRYIDLGLNKSAICKLVGCSRSTLYDWIERRKVAT